jgi:hypothetical protein
MSRIGRRNLPILLMAGANLVVGCIVYAEIRARPMIPDPEVSAGEIRVPPLPEARAAMPSRGTFTAIVERPLFSPSRRPPVEGIAADSIPILDFSLFGIVISTGEPSAIVKPDSGGDPVRVTEGETMSGWTVARIEADRILVQQGATERELLLDFSAPAPPPPEMAMPNDPVADGQAATSANLQSQEVDDSEQSIQQAPQPGAGEP